MTFAGGALDRAADRRTDEAWIAAARNDPRARAVLVGPGGVVLAGEAVRLVPLEAESGTSRFDITLLMTEMADGLAGSIQYNSDLFDAATIERLICHFETLLEGVVADPKQPIARLPLLTAAERA